MDEKRAAVIERFHQAGRDRTMLVHLDASTHEWIAGLPMQDLVVALDDADGRILYARFFPQEGTASTFAALESVVRNYGRFCELYTERGSHFCHSERPGEVADEQNGQVSQALRALGIHQILARSQQARGRSERAFGTLQGRLPQELRHNRITDYAAANRYLEQHFIADFNRRFTVKPAQQAVIATNVSNHPAAEAWKKIRGHPEPHMIQVIQEDNRQSAVYRLIGAGPGGITIIAHRLKPLAAAVECTIYENILPQLPVTALRWYGSVIDEDTQLHWLFLEDAGEGKYSPCLREHRAAAASWLGALNVSAQQLRRQSCLPDRSCRYYYELLRLGSAAILKIAEHAVVTAEDRIILTAIATHCDLVEKRWDAISRFCDRIPPTLVHGDLASKNICVRTDHRDTHFFVMDWESAGWGVPAADLAQSTFGSASPDLEVYWSVVQPAWPPQLAFTDLQRLAEVGNLFRVVSALKWANSGFRPEFLEWYMMNMRFYESALRAWLERAAAYE